MPIDNSADVQSANLLQQFAAQTALSSPSSMRKPKQIQVFRLGRVPAKRQAEGAAVIMKSLWETKEKSGNETGRTNQPDAPSIFDFLSLVESESPMVQEAE